MFFYYFKEAFNGIFRAKLSSFITLLILSAAVFFTAVTAGLFFYSAKIENKIKENVTIRLFLDREITDEQVEAIAATVQNLGYSTKVDIVTKEEAAQKLISETGNNFIEILGENPLPATLVVKLKGDAVKTGDFDRIMNYYTEIEGIESADFDYRMSLRLIHYLHSARTIVIGVSLFLVIFAIYFTYLTNRLINETKARQFNTMKLVGANISTIKYPLYLRGFILGLLASVIIGTGIFMVYSILPELALTIQIEKRSVYLLMAVVLISGVLYGTGGSIYAARGINYKINLK